MAKHVVLTSIAENDLEQLTDYLLQNWGTAVVERFLLRFEYVCNLLSISPDIYPLINKKRKIRKCVLTPQNVLYLYVETDSIVIITLFDSRQDPEKLNELIDNF